MKIFVLGAAAVALLMAGAGEPLRVWTGFSRVATEASGKSRIRYADLLVGSNERAAAAQPLELVIWLGVTDAQGKAVCTALTEVKTKLQPDAARPLRFAVTYPAEGAPETARSTYKLFSKVNWKTEGRRPRHGLVENVMTVSLPAGGVPACEKN